MPETRDSNGERPHGRAFLTRGFAVPVLLRLWNDGPLSENQLRTTVPYNGMLTALADLTEAGWVEQVTLLRRGREGGRDPDDPSRSNRGDRCERSAVKRWMLTDTGVTVAGSLWNAGTVMDLLDGMRPSGGVPEEGSERVSDDGSEDARNHAD